MTRAAFFLRADNRTQDFSKTYRGSPIQPNVVVLHTTEGPSWPSYGGGATAPHLTAKPNFKTQSLEWRQHFPLTMSARALRNEAGGVETNTLNCVQVELIGSCAPPNKGKSGWMFWPDAPDWALQEVAEFLAFMHREWALQFKAPTFLPYPSSYGATKVRMTGTRWRDFYGVCGHQHVPENSHGDPGDIDIKDILKRAKALVEPPKPKSKTPNADKVAEIAASVLDGKKQTKARRETWATIQEAAESLRKKG